MTQQLQYNFSHDTVVILLYTITSGTIQCHILQLRGFYLLEKFISSLHGLSQWMGLA